MLKVSACAQIFTAHIDGCGQVFCATHWITEHLSWLPQFNTVYVFVDNRALAGADPPDYWPWLAPWIQARCNVIGPHGEKTTAIHFPITAETGLHQVHYTWAGAPVLEALCLVHPTVNFALSDSDCVPTSLFEVAELVLLMTDKATRKQAMQHQTMANSPCSPPAVLLMTEARAELNAGLIIVTSHTPTQTDDVDMEPDNMEKGGQAPPVPKDRIWPRHGNSRYIYYKHSDRMSPFMIWARPIFEQGALSPMSVLRAEFPIICLPGDKMFQSKEINPGYSLPPIVYAFYGNKMALGRKLAAQQSKELQPLPSSLLAVEQAPPPFGHTPMAATSSEARALRVGTKSCRNVRSQRCRRFCSNAYGPQWTSPITTTTTFVGSLFRLHPGVDSGLHNGPLPFDFPMRDIDLYNA